MIGPGDARETAQGSAASSPPSCPFCRAGATRLRSFVVSNINGKRYDHRVCSGCGLEFFTPLEFEDVYATELYEDYAEIHQGDPHNVPLWTASVVEAVARRFPQGLTGKQVLDIGCGNGLCFRLFQERLGLTADDYHGLDIDDKSLEAAGRMGVRHRHRGFFGAEFAARHQQAFDVVVSTEVVEHQTDPRGFFSALFQVVRPGGWIFLTTPNRDRFFLRWREVQGDMPPHHFLRFNRRFFLHNFGPLVAETRTLAEKGNYLKSGRALSRRVLGTSGFWPFLLPVAALLRAMDALEGKDLLVVLRKDSHQPASLVEPRRDA